MSSDPLKAAAPFMAAGAPEANNKWCLLFFGAGPIKNLRYN
jgi:hypothetical protein